MKKIITKYLLFAGIILFSIKGMSQQDPLFTQYMYNMSVMNPAYATDDPGMLNLGAIYRMQWTDVDGAPRTLNFFAHTPISERVELGITVVHDEIGNIEKQNKCPNNSRKKSSNKLRTPLGKIPCKTNHPECQNSIRIKICILRPD